MVDIDLEEQPESPQVIELEEEDAEDILERELEPVRSRRARTRSREATREKDRTTSKESRRPNHWHMRTRRQ